MALGNVAGSTTIGCNGIVLFVVFAFHGRKIRIVSDLCIELAVPDTTPPSSSLLQKRTFGAACEYDMTGNDDEIVISPSTTTRIRFAE